MKKAKFVVLVSVLAFALGVFADAANVLVAFSTKGPDTYADGKTVVQGEWYALCWSPRATFGGITPVCSAALADERVLICSKLAKGGCCPCTVFQVDSKVAPVGGNYFVYLLDTRVNGIPASQGADGKPSVLNGSAATSVAAVSAGSGAVVSGVGATADGATWADASVESMLADGSIKNPTITGITLISDAQVQITVADMHPSVQYDVITGDTPQNLIKTPVAPLTGISGGEVNFIVDKKDGKFFRVERHKLVK